MAQDFAVPINTSSSIAQAVSDASTALATLRSGFSGATAPTDPTPVAGQTWWDTNTQRLMVFNGALWLPMGGRLLENLTPVSTAGSSEEDLQSVVLPANTLSVDGQRLRIIAVGHTANNANDRFFGLNFGATQLILMKDPGNSAVVEFRIMCDVVRTGSSAQVISTMATRVDGTAAPRTEIGRASLSEDLTAAITIKTRGDGVSAADVVSDFLTVELIH
jgi:hypothetical protein